MTPKSEMRDYFDAMAPERDRWAAKGRYYHESLLKTLRFCVPEGSSVLQIGCGTGEALAALKPSRGVGVDLSPAMIANARAKHPGLDFRVGDFDDLGVTGTFDYVVIVGVIGFVEDVQTCFKNLRKVCRPDTRIIVVSYNYLWEPVLKFAEKAGRRMPRPTQHWLPAQDVRNFLYLNGFTVVKSFTRMLMPLRIPLLSAFCNVILANLPGLRRLCLNEIVVARLDAPRKPMTETTCSVIVPCRNEKGNVEAAVTRTPDMGAHTEIIFVEGHSTDATLEECERVRDAYPDRDIAVLVQDGSGKGDAVRKGFAHAKGDVLMILDADLTVPPEDLPKFFESLVSGKGEFINGSRLVYQMEKQAMRFLNLIANKFFSLAFTYLLDQRLRDTLCGTKVLWREDYLRITAGRAYFGDFDPFGDFDLIFGAAKMCLHIVEVPIRYRERTYGETQISRFRHGWLLLKMTLYAMKKMKFIG